MKFRTKLTLLFIAITLFLTIVSTLFIYYSNLKILEAQINNRLKDDASHVMDKIDRMLFERFSDIKTIASDPNISSRTTTPRQITERLIEYRNLHKTYISLSFFDLNRVRTADTAGLDIGKQRSLDPYWERVLKNEDFIMEISKSESLQFVSFLFASLVKNRSEFPIGVVVSRMPVERLYDIVRETLFPLQKGEEEIKIDLVDKNGLIIYSTYNRQGILKDRFEEWESLGSSFPGEKVGSLRHFHSGKEEYIHIVAKEQGHLDFKGNGWTLHIQIPIKVALAPVVGLRNKIIAVALSIILFSIIIVLFFARTISRPIIELRNAAIEVSRGNLDVNIEVKSKDEVGELGLSFKKMVEDLKSSRDRLLAYSSELERKVSERTAELQDINEHLRVELVERKKAEEALQESRERYRTLFENVPIGLYRTTGDGQIIDANPALVEILGYPDHASLLTINAADAYVDPEARTERQNILKHKRFLKDHEMQLRRLDGSVLWVEDNVRVIYHADGRILYYEGSFRDITERKKMEEILKVSTRQWQTTFEGINDAICLLDMEGKILQCNKAMATLLGKSFSEIIGSICCKLVHGTSGPVEGCPRIRMRETRSRENLVLSMEDQWFNVSSDPILDETDHLIGTVHIISDITGRKRAEEEREKLIGSLQEALSKVKMLSGLLPICASCKKIRDDKGYWGQIESYISDHSEAEFSHGICPDCMKKLYPDFADNKNSV